MKRTSQPPGKSILKLNRQTLRALTREQIERMDGGTLPATYMCTGNCAGSNNSCINGTCHEN